MTTEEEVLVLKQATREAHEAMQDLSRIIKEAKHVQAHLTDEAIKVLDSGIAEIVAAGLDDYKTTIGKAIEDATAAVFKRFDTISDLLMGEDRTNRRRGEPTLTELVEHSKEHPRDG